MTREDIKAKLISVIDEYNYEGIEITEETSSSDLFWDSLDKVECLMAVEKAFGLSISDEEAESVKNVNEAIDLLENLLK